MAFIKNPAELDRLIAEALDLPEIKKRLSELSVRRSARLADQVRQRSDFLWEAARSEIEFFERLEEKLGSDEKQIENAVLAPPPAVRIVRERPARPPRLAHHTRLSSPRLVPGLDRALQVARNFPCPGCDRDHRNRAGSAVRFFPAA